MSYFDPHIPTWDTGLIPIERHVREDCAILLFNISGETLSVASMVEVRRQTSRHPPPLSLTPSFNSFTSSGLLLHRAKVCGGPMSQ